MLFIQFSIKLSLFLWWDAWNVTLTRNVNTPNPEYVTILRGGVFIWFLYENKSKNEGPRTA